MAQVEGSGITAPEISPVKVASVIDVECVRTKSSADSISNFPSLDGREAVAIFPSGFPVLKKVVPAAAGSPKRAAEQRHWNCKPYVRLGHRVSPHRINPSGTTSLSLVTDETGVRRPSV